jgi:hypothetical protein
MANSIVEVPTPEYLIHWPSFVAYASLYNLVLVDTSLFDAAYKKYHRSNLSRVELEVAFINRTFVFQKQVLAPPAGTATSKGGRRTST